MDRATESFEPTPNWMLYTDGPKPVLTGNSWTDFGSEQAIDRFSKEVYAKPSSELANDMTPKANRVLLACGKGLYDGVAEDIEAIVREPQKLLPAVELGVGIAALGVVAPEIAAVAGAGALITVGAAALELRNHTDEMSAAVNEAWTGSGTLDHSAKQLRPLGHFALTAMIARPSSGFSWRAIGYTNARLVNWIHNK